MLNKSESITIKLNYKILCLILLIIIIGMFALWRPWQNSTETQRKVTISGEATIKAEPDEYQFNPAYERKTTAETTKVSNEVTTKLKSLGVEDSKIKIDSNRYKTYTGTNPDVETTTISMTVTVNNKELAQKVQDYLITTNPSGAVTPYVTFSKDKQKELETIAREEAIADAKKQAESTAIGFGAKVDKVLEVSENQDYGIMPMLEGGSSISSDIASDKSLSLQPGENEFTYQISAVFSLK